MALVCWVEDNPRWVAHVVEDGEDTGHSVRAPAQNKDSIKSPGADFMGITKCVFDVDWRVLAFEVNYSQNS